MKVYLDPQVNHNTRLIHATRCNKRVLRVGDNVDRVASKLYARLLPTASRPPQPRGNGCLPNQHHELPGDRREVDHDVRHLYHPHKLLVPYCEGFWVAKYQTITSYLGGCLISQHLIDQTMACQAGHPHFILNYLRPVICPNEATLIQ